MQVKETLLQKCLEVEKTAKEQAADNVILDRVSKVNILISGILGITINLFSVGLERVICINMFMATFMALPVQLNFDIIYIL